MKALNRIFNGYPTTGKSPELHKSILRVFISFALTIMLIFSSLAEIKAAVPYTYSYLGNSASNDDHHDLFDETQGLANGEPRAGDPFWFFSKNLGGVGHESDTTLIYRVPYTEHLAHTFRYNQREIRLPAGSGICGHVGDIDYHVYRGKGYIIAGYDECSDGKARIAFFQSKDINGASAILAPWAVMVVDRRQLGGAPWVSVHRDGRVFSSAGWNKLANIIFEYTIDWRRIRSGGNLRYKSMRMLKLVDYKGDRVNMPYKQGADISTDGHRFFILMGGEDGTTKGIWVFNLEKNKLVLSQRSSNSKKPFKYETHNSIPGYPQEPEGLSYFNANNIHPYHRDMQRGVLHAILLNNKVLSSDGVWIKHYQEKRNKPPKPPSRNYPTQCSKYVQGKIAWDYKGHKRWAQINLTRLCRGAERSNEPAACFKRVMHGGVNYGGGTKWMWQNAIDLCEGSKNANSTIRCFERKIKRGISWKSAIRSCG